MKIIRLIAIFLIGGLLLYSSYRIQYRMHFVDVLYGYTYSIAGIIVLLWTIIMDIKLYRIQRRVQNFSFTFLCFLCLGTILLLQRHIVNRFNSPTLLKVFYDGDYNGISIDFKENGTYIFENSAIGMSDYTYGSYGIDGNIIHLDRDTIANIHSLKNLQIIEKIIPQQERTEKESYLVSIEANDSSRPYPLEYRVTIDNRRPL